MNKNDSIDSEPANWKEDCWPICRRTSSMVQLVFVHFRHLSFSPWPSHTCLLGSAPFLVYLNPLPFPVLLLCLLTLWFSTGFVLLHISPVSCSPVVLIFCVWRFSETSRLEWPSRAHSASPGSTHTPWNRLHRAQQGKIPDRMRGRKKTRQECKHWESNKADKAHRH